ncbi:MAG: AMP-binding protein [Chloroflexi bacterium]|nr:AMP-binding protein [Chloroflexota bacterium]
MDLKTKTIYALFEHNAQAFGQSPAFIAGEETVTYAQFLERVDKLAAGLSDHNVSKGDRVCILAQNSVAFMELLVACAKIGAILYPVNWRLAADEIFGIISLADPKMLVVDPEFLSQLEGADLTAIPTKLLFGTESKLGYGLLTEIYNDEIRSAEAVESQDPAAIISTAATGGVPRGAVLTHGNFAAVSSLFVESFKLTPEDRFLAVLPFFHIAGLNNSLGIAWAGGANVVMETFDPALGAKLIDDHQVTLIGTFPPMLEMLLGAREQLEASWSSLKYCFGLLNPPEVVKKFIIDVGAEYWTGFGQTETSGIATFLNVAEKPGSAGKVVPNLELRIANSAGEEIPVGDPGEITVKGPLVFAGYWRDEDATNFTSRYGWHHTGDVGKVDEEGYLYYIGRKPEKELIKTGGENVYPAEVEHAVRELAEVTEVCVIGVPDEKWGEAVKAVVELAEGKTITAEQIISAAGEKIASYKKPQQVDFVNKLPRLENGEIDRMAVKVAHG